MRKFLSDVDAVFYHVTPLSKWNLIQESGSLLASDNKIFLSRSSDKSVLYSIALTQVLELDGEKAFVVLALPQSLNQFRDDEFAADFQATEPTMPFHSVLNRDAILLENVKFVEECNGDDPEVIKLASKADGPLFLETAGFKEALEVEYMQKNNKLFYHVSMEVKERRPIFTKAY